MKILTTPDPFLKQVAKPVTKYDKKLEQQIASMIDTLKTARDPEGVGLAATQIGLDRRLFIVALSGRPEIFINPKISNESEAMLSDVHKRNRDRWLEGCLSVPGLWGFVDRPYAIDVDYQTPDNGVLVPRHRHFADVEASYIQHENDHLDGILFTDLILKQGGQLFKDTPDGLTPIDF